MKAIVISVAAVFAVGVAGCFSPKYTEGGLRCGPAGECPSGYACQQDHCYTNGGGNAPPDMAVEPVGPDMVSTLPICVIGSNTFGDACRFGP